MSWRPDDWKNPYEVEVEAIVSRGGHRGSVNTEYLEGKSDPFEAGADAILKALILRGNTILFTPGVIQATDPTIIKASLPNERGYWVLIPEVKENDANI